MPWCLAKLQFARHTCDHDGREPSVVLSNIRLLGGDGPSDVSWSADGRIFYRLMESGPVGQYGNVWSVEVDPATGRVRGTPSQVTSGTGFSQHGFSQSDGRRHTFVRQHDRDTIRVADLQSGDALGTSHALSGDNWNKWLSGWTHDSGAVLFVSNPQQKWGSSSTTCGRTRRNLWWSVQIVMTTLW
jgi:hypothetical protein